MNDLSPIYDSLVVGGGPAGLTTASANKRYFAGPGGSRPADYLHAGGEGHECKDANS